MANEEIVKNGLAVAEATTQALGAIKEELQGKKVPEKIWSTTGSLRTRNTALLSQLKEPENLNVYEINEHAKKIEAYSQETASLLESSKLLTDKLQTFLAKVGETVKTLKDALGPVSPKPTSPILTKPDKTNARENKRKERSPINSTISLNDAPPSPSAAPSTKRATPLTPPPSPLLTNIS